MVVAEEEDLGFVFVLGGIVAYLEGEDLPVLEGQADSRELRRIGVGARQGFEVGLELEVGVVLAV